MIHMQLLVSFSMLLVGICCTCHAVTCFCAAMHRTSMWKSYVQHWWWLTPAFRTEWRLVKQLL